MWPRVAVIVFGLLVLLSRPSIAASASVEGVVKDASGMPIVGARIVLSAPSGRYEALAGSSGTFSIASVVEGLYGLQVRATGFAPITNREVSVTPEAVARIEVVLLRAGAGGVASLGSVVVNGSTALSRASAPTAEINPQALASEGAVQLSDVLARQIAVTMVRQGGGAPGLPQSAALRGPDPSETIVDIDGHQVNNNTGDVQLE